MRVIGPLLLGRYQKDAACAANANGKDKSGGKKPLYCLQPPGDEAIEEMRDAEIFRRAVHDTVFRRMPSKEEW